MNVSQTPIEMMLQYRPSKLKVESRILPRSECQHTKREKATHSMLWCGEWIQIGSSTVAK